MITADDSDRSTSSNDDKSSSTCHSIYTRTRRFTYKTSIYSTLDTVVHVLGLLSMGSCASKSCDWCWMMRKVLQAMARRGHQGAAAVHPWTPPEVPPAGQRVTVRMRASEFRALAAVRRATGAGAGAGDGEFFGDRSGDVARLILDGCAAGRWAWSPAPE